MTAMAMPDLATANNTGNTITILRNKGSNEPAINSFTPAIGPAGTVVTITGVNLSGITGVSFGGTAAASYTLVSSTTITATVGAGATGNVTVTSTTAGTMSLPGYIYGTPPSISSISPDSGATGPPYCLSGTGFTGTSILTFGGTPANSFTVLSDSTISAVVGVGSTGNVAITTPTDTASIGGFSYIYTPLPPVQLTAFRRTVPDRATIDDHGSKSVGYYHHHLWRNAGLSLQCHFGLGDLCGSRTRIFRYPGGQRQQW
jgi:hypothetical protein